MRLDNMRISELQAEIARQAQRISHADAQLARINSQRDYSDEIAKYWHMGKVGYRKDTKRQDRTLDKAIDVGIRACNQYEIRSDAKSIIEGCQDAIAYITAHAPSDGVEGYTLKMARDYTRQTALGNAPALTWAKVIGHYGPAYRSGNYEVERCDAEFVAVRDLASDNLITHCKTVREAKAIAALLAHRED